MPFHAFLALRAHTTRDRDLAPQCGQSSRQASVRALAATPALPGPVAAVTHGGITTELLRDLPGGDALRPGVLGRGYPYERRHRHRRPNPIMIASVSHLE
jgi:hypothetical protein